MVVAKSKNGERKPKRPASKPPATKKAASVRRAKTKKAPTKKAGAEKMAKPGKIKEGKIEIPPPTVKGKAFAASEKELAEFFNCSRSTISRLKRRPNCPKTTADGKYPLAEWKEFFERESGEFSIDDGELAFERKAKRQLAEVRLERERFELEIEQGKFISIDEACAVIAQAFAGTVQAFRDSEHTVAPLVAGLDVPEARSVIRSANIDALQRFSLGDWAKKKPFWRTVYAQLRDLQATSSLGSGLSET